jgi:hypothetical protein
MATKTKTVKTPQTSKFEEYEKNVTLLQTLEKTNQGYEIQRYDNGFLLEVGGRDYNDDWISLKLVVNSEAELIDLIKVVHTLPKDR